VRTFSPRKFFDPRMSLPQMLRIVPSRHFPPERIKEGDELLPGAELFESKISPSENISSCASISYLLSFLTVELINFLGS